MIEKLISKPKQVCGPHVRWMIRRDLVDSVIAMEKLCFCYPWTEEDFCRKLRERDCIGMVCEIDEEVVGYMIYELHKKRLNIVNFAIDPAHQREGLGRMMIERLVSKLSYQRRNRITLEVCESNLNAQLFFKACGFRAEDVLRDYYPETGEDAYVMVYRTSFEDSQPA
jgi:ribosomal-protein-alanine N-acetyltransferase